MARDEENPPKNNPVIKLPQQDVPSESQQNLPGKPIGPGNRIEELEIGKGSGGGITRLPSANPSGDLEL